MSGTDSAAALKDALHAFGYASQVTAAELRGILTHGKPPLVASEVDEVIAALMTDLKVDQAGAMSIEGLVSKLCTVSKRGQTPAVSAPKEARLTDHETLMRMPLTVVIFGATGDLAKKKLVRVAQRPATHAL